MVEIPADRPDAPPSPLRVAGEPAAPDYTKVLLRHADPVVMANLLPVLDIPQRSRLFGSAAALVLDLPGRGPLYAPRLETFGTPSGGLIRISAQQYKALTDANLDISRRKVAAYLREVDPGGTEGLSEADLARHVRHYETLADEVGLQSEVEHMKWAYLMQILAGDTAAMKAAQDEIRTARRPPGATLDAILDALDNAWARAL